MGDSEQWTLFSERLFRTRGKPAQMALIAIILVSTAFIVSMIGLVANDRLVLIEFNVDLILSSVASVFFFAVFGWGAVFVKNAYIQTISKLKLKDEELREKYLQWETVFSNKHAAFGVLLTYGLLAIAIAYWPLVSTLFPLTLGTAPYIIIIAIIMGLVGVFGVDAIGAIPSLLFIPRELSNDVQLNILLPDRCGGAKSVGDFYFVFTLLVASIGSLTVVIASSFENQFYGYGLAGSFLFLAIAVFLLPQLSFREVLKEEKIKRLEDIAERIDKLSQQEEPDESDEILMSFIQVQSLIMLYGEIEKLHEFPFETSTLQKVISTSFIPIILEIVLIIIQFS